MKDEELIEKLEKFFKGYHFTVETKIDDSDFKTIRSVVVKGLTPFQKEHKISWCVESQMDMTALTGKQVEEILFATLLNEVFKALIKMKVE
jgi:hypothetical protein